MPVYCHEPSSIHAIETTAEYNASKALFQEQEWDHVFGHFQGYSDEVAMTFAKTFHLDTTTIGDLSIKVTKETIAQAMGLPLSGEKWSKNHGL